MLGYLVTCDCSHGKFSMLENVISVSKQALYLHSITFWNVMYIRVHLETKLLKWL